MFRRSGEKVIRLCEAAMKQNKQEASDRLLEVAEIEEKAYRLLLSNSFWMLEREYVFFTGS